MWGRAGWISWEIRSLGALDPQVRPYVGRMSDMAKIVRRYSLILTEFFFLRAMEMHSVRSVGFDIVWEALTTPIETSCAVGRWPDRTLCIKPTCCWHLAEIQAKGLWSVVLKFLSRSGLSLLKAWITFTLRNALVFISPR